MALHRDDFAAFVEEMQARQFRSGLEGLADLFGELGLFLEAHEATDYEYRALVALLLSPVLRQHLPSEPKCDIIRVCSEGLGLEIRQTN